MTLRLPHPSWILAAAVLMMVVAVGLGIAIPSYQQQAALREIKRLGGNVSFRSSGPEWLRRRIGDERMQPFDDVDAVDLTRSEVSDGDLIWLKQLRGMRELNLWTARISDDGLALVRGLTTLRKRRRTAYGRPDQSVMPYSPAQSENATVSELSPLSTVIRGV